MDNNTIYHKDYTIKHLCYTCLTHGDVQTNHNDGQ
jgi:hypothetical protein